MAAAVTTAEVVVCLYLLTFSIITSKAAATTKISFQHRYQLGKEAYLENDWRLCVKHMEEAAAEFNLHHSALNKCRKKCKRDNKFSPLVEEDVEDLHFFEKNMETTLCLIKECDLEKHADQPVLDELTRRVPYNYLQICYHKLNRTEDAANAAYTYQVRNPVDQQALDNANWYLEQITVTDPDFQMVDKESLPHEVKYIEAVTRYSKEDWNQAIKIMEESIVDYLEAEEDCRLECETPQDMAWFPDFAISISKHFTFCLRCKRKCQVTLSRFKNHIDKELALPSMYFYLMYSYYKVGDLKKAAQCIASHQLVNPYHETMARNKKYLLNVSIIEEKWFSPREEAVRYQGRDLYERKLGKFIDMNFAILDGTKTKPSMKSKEKLA